MYVGVTGQGHGGVIEEDFALAISAHAKAAAGDAAEACARSNDTARAKIGRESSTAPARSAASGM